VYTVLTAGYKVIAGCFADKLYGSTAMPADITSTMAMGTALIAGYNAIEGCFVDKASGDKAMLSDVSVM
jgi:hypothetical protein